MLRKFILFFVAFVIVFQLVNVAEGTSSFEYQFQWGSEGTGNGQFRNPSGIAVDSEGNVYVADTDNHRIQKFSPDGAFLFSWGSEGTGDNQFIYPTALAVGKSDNIFVADQVESSDPYYIGYVGRVKKFDKNGRFLLKWGGAISGHKKFMEISGLGIGETGNLLVQCVNDDDGPWKIEFFSPTGEYLKEWNTGDSGTASYHGGKIGVGAGGNLFVDMPVSYVTKEFTQTGTVLATNSEGCNGLTAAVGDGKVYGIQDRYIMVLDANNLSLLERISGPLYEGPGPFIGGFSDMAMSPDQKTIYVLSEGTRTGVLVFKKQIALKFKVKIKSGLPSMYYPSSYNSSIGVVGATVTIKKGTTVIEVKDTDQNAYATFYAGPRQAYEISATESFVVNGVSTPYLGKINFTAPSSSSGIVEQTIYIEPNRGGSSPQ